MQVPLVRYENGERKIIGVAEVEPDLSQPGVIAVSAEVTDPDMIALISLGGHHGDAMLDGSVSIKGVDDYES